MLHRDKAPLEVGSLYWELRDSVVNCELMMLRILQFHVAFNNPHKVPKFNPPPQACCLVFNLLSLRGRRSKGKGKGIRARDHARGRREGGELPRAPLAFLSRLKLPFPKLPFPSLLNACHAGYNFLWIDVWTNSMGNHPYSRLHCG